MYGYKAVEGLKGFERRLKALYAQLKEEKVPLPPQSAQAGMCNVALVKGPYSDFRKKFAQVGWIVIDDDSKDFNILFRLRNSDLPWFSIQPWQYCNHFAGNQIVTTKSGLVGLLKAEDIDISPKLFYPEAYRVVTAAEGECPRLNFPSEAGRDDTLAFIERYLDLECLKRCYAYLLARIDESDAEEVVSLQDFVAGRVGGGLPLDSERYARTFSSLWIPPASGRGSSGGETSLAGEGVSGGSEEATCLPTNGTYSISSLRAMLRRMREILPGVSEDEFKLCYRHVLYKNMLYRHQLIDSGAGRYFPEPLWPEEIRSILSTLPEGYPVPNYRQAPALSKLQDGPTWTKPRSGSTGAKLYGRRSGSSGSAGGAEGTASAAERPGGGDRKGGKRLALATGSGASAASAASASPAPAKGNARNRLGLSGVPMPMPSLATLAGELRAYVAYDPQGCISSGLQNVYIGKPGAKSRGRGIFCSDGVQNLLTLKAESLEGSENDEDADEAGAAAPVGREDAAGGSGSKADASGISGAPDAPGAPERAGATDTSDAPEAEPGGEPSKKKPHLAADSAISTSDRYVVQKYIENPLLLGGFKFDIRQWVLVTSTNPLMVFQWTRPYLRFCSERYDGDPRMLGNPFIHLSNNSVQKYSDVFGGENEFLKYGNMWPWEKFESYVEEELEAVRAETGVATRVGEQESGKDSGRSSASNGPLPPRADLSTLYTSRFDPSKRFPTVASKCMHEMARIIVTTMLAARGEIDGRHKNAFELFGFDFIMDDEFRTWLLEINCSPTMEHSTEIVTGLIDEMSTGMVNIIARASLGRDLTTTAREMYPRVTNAEAVFGPEGMEALTGWRLIFNERRQSGGSFLNLSVSGKPLKLPTGIRGGGCAGAAVGSSVGAVTNGEAKGAAGRSGEAAERNTGTLP